MSIHVRLMLIMLALCGVVVGGLTLGAQIYNKNATETAIDDTLLTIAYCAKATLPEDFHDRIEGPDSVSAEEYEKIVARFDRLCEAVGVQYIWSLMLVDGVPVFTTASSPEKNGAPHGYAHFFEPHGAPESYRAAFDTMTVQKTNYNDKWGRGRMVLAPFTDAHGRKYLFAAGKKMGELRSRLHNLAVISLGGALAAMLLGLIVSWGFSRWFSRPFRQLALDAERIAEGDLEHEIQSSYLLEFNQLSKSLNSMRGALHARIEELAKKNEQLAAQIQARERIEENMHRSESFLANIINAIEDPIFVKDEEHRWVLLNQAWYRAMNQTPEQVIGKSDLDLYPEEQVRVFWENDEKVLTTGTPNINIEAITILNDVRTVVTKKALFKDTTGARFITGIMRDITDIKRTEEALRTSEMRFRTLAENLPGVVYLCENDQRFRMHYLNQAVEDVTGFQRSDFISDKVSFVELYHPDDAAGVYAEVEQALDEGRPFHLLYRLRRADGEWRWVEEYGTEINENGKAYLEGFLRDITDRVVAEEERRRLEAQVQHGQKLESLGVLAGGIAHDFNNILMAILGNADLAQVRMDAASPAQRNIDDIIKASRRAAELCNQMLAYSGKGRFLVQPINLSELVNEMASILGVSISKKVELEFLFPETLPAVDADPTQLRQVVMNLITNASEAIGDHDGIISLSTGVCECDGDYLKNALFTENLVPGKYVFLEVNDTGCGMDQQTIERVFEPFFSTKFTGRGLGMAAVLGIVRGHKGFITIQSEPDVGTTFRIYFPASARESVSLTALPAVAPEAAEEAPHGGLILLVDDEATVRDVGEQMLEAIGFEAIVASDGFDAIRLYQEHAKKIVCVILDLTMPKMDGQECLRELRHIAPDARVLLTSGYTEEEIAERFEGQGLAGFIQKPFQVSSLRTALIRALS